MFIVNAKNANGVKNANDLRKWFIVNCGNADRVRVRQGFDDFVSKFQQDYVPVDHGTLPINWNEKIGQAWPVARTNEKYSEITTKGKHVRVSKRMKTALNSIGLYHWNELFEQGYDFFGLFFQTVIVGRATVADFFNMVQAVAEEGGLYIVPPQLLASTESDHREAGVIRLAKTEAEDYNKAA